MERNDTNPQQSEGPSKYNSKAGDSLSGLALVRGRLLVSLGMILLVIFGIITASVLLIDVLALDVPITHEVQEFDFVPLNWLLLAVSAPGFSPWSYIFPIAIVLVLVLLRRGVEAGFMALAGLGSGAASIAKALVHRVRPSEELARVVQSLDSYSFPSGHVTQYTLVFGFCFYLAFTLMKPGLLRTLLLMGTGAMVLLVGPSRIWMGQHWATDVLGGYTLGFGLLMLIIWAYRKWQAHRA